MDRKYFRYVSTLFIVLPMTLVMALVGLARTYGFNSGWINKFFNSWMIMAPVAYAAAFIIIPQALKLTEKLMKTKQ